MEESKETKKAKVEKEVIGEEIKAQSASVQPEAPAAVVGKPPKVKNKQMIITLAIVSGVVLFFLGLGLGYLLGHSTASTSRNSLPTNRNFTPPSDGGGRRFNPSSGTDDSTNDSNGDTKTQTN